MHRGVKRDGKTLLLYRGTSQESATAGPATTSLYYMDVLTRRLHAEAH